jgi:hypothetical protein
MCVVYRSRQSFFAAMTSAGAQEQFTAATSPSGLRLYIFDCGPLGE